MKCRPWFCPGYNLTEIEGLRYSFKVEFSCIGISAVVSWQSLTCKAIRRIVMLIGGRVIGLSLDKIGEEVVDRRLKAGSSQDAEPYVVWSSITLFNIHARMKG